MGEPLAGTSLTQWRAAITAAAQSLSCLVAGVPDAADADLGPVLSEVDAVCAAAAGARVAVVAEAMSRGVSVGPPWGASAGWVTSHASSLTSAAAGALVKAVQATSDVQFHGVREALHSGRLDPWTAIAVCDTFRALTPRLRPEAHEDAIAGMVEVGAVAGTPGVHQMRERLISAFGAEDELDAVEESARRLATLSSGRSLGDGLWDYRMLLTTEGRAVLEAAIGRSSRPLPAIDPASGVSVPDDRPVGQRRAEALVSALRRGDDPVLTPEGQGSAAGGAKAAVIVTMTLGDLCGHRGAGEVIGSPAAGNLLAPNVLRRLACDAEIIPAVLGSDGELLDLGRATRLFTSKQTRAMWLRDRHCSYPGCDIPAQWCDAHHLTHWADGGSTAVNNAALLCPRHHQHVHTHRLLGQVLEGSVVWDTRPHSYPRRP